MYADDPDKPAGYYGPVESMQKDKAPEARGDEQAAMRLDERSTHQQNVDAVKRRGHFNRVTAKLRYWAASRR